MRPAIFAAALALAACAPTLVEMQTAPAAPPSSPIAAAIAPSQGTSLDPADAAAGAYTLDPRHASIVWRVRHLGIGLYTARFDRIAGALNFDPAAPENSTLEATTEANSVSTGLLNSEGERAFDGEIARLLGAEDHPQIRFVSREVTRTGPTSGVITGDLTLNGQTHPVTLEATFHGGRTIALLGGRRVIGFSARTIINRSQWGVGNALFNQFAGDEVEILIDAEFNKT